MRPREIGAVRFADLDRTVRPLTRITISVARRLVSGGDGPTKTQAVKQVPVHPVLERLLTDWRQRGWAEFTGRSPTDRDLVTPAFRGRRKGSGLNGSTATRAFHTDCKVAGVRDLHLNCARHTFITLTQEDGGDSNVLRWITHAPPRTAYDGYSRQQWTSLCREISKFQIVLPTSTDAKGPSSVTKPPPSSAANTLADTLARSVALAANAVEKAIASGSTEESNLPRDAKGTVATSFEDWARHQIRSCFQCVR